MKKLLIIIALFVTGGYGRGVQDGRKIPSEADLQQLRPQIIATDSYKDNEGVIHTIHYIAPNKKPPMLVNSNINNGFLAETPEVANARQEHLNLFAKERELHALLKHDDDTQNVKPIENRRIVAPQRVPSQATFINMPFPELQRRELQRVLENSSPARPPTRIVQRLHPQIIENQQNLPPVHRIQPQIIENQQNLPPVLRLQPQIIENQQNIPPVHRFAPKPIEQRVENQQFSRIVENPNFVLQPIEQPRIIEKQRNIPSLVRDIESTTLVYSTTPKLKYQLIDFVGDEEETEKPKVNHVQSDNQHFISDPRLIDPNYRFLFN